MMGVVELPSPMVPTKLIVYTSVDQPEVFASTTIQVPQPTNGGSEDGQLNY